MIWRTKNQARYQGIVQLKDSICFKSVQIGSKEIRPRYSPTQGFNLLQISPNWFQGNLTLDPRLKWALVKPLARGFLQNHAHLSSTSHSKAHSQGFYLHSHGSLIWHLSTLEPSGSRDLVQIVMVVIPSPFALFFSLPFLNMVSTTHVQH